MSFLLCAEGATLIDESVFYTKSKRFSLKEDPISKDCLTHRSKRGIIFGKQKQGVFIRDKSMFVRSTCKCAYMRACKRSSARLCISLHDCMYVCKSIEI